MRTIEELQRDQAEVLRQYLGERTAKEAVALLPRPGGGVAPVVYGRVAEKVSADGTHGPHLVVVRQAWSGVPPVRSDGSGEPWRCYPSPDRTVDDYAVDEVVRVAATYGAMIAERLS